MKTDLATRSIDAMVARIDEALTEPREPFAWMPVLREHASADVPGPMAYDGEALAPVGEIDEVQWMTPRMWEFLEANAWAPSRMIGGSNA